MAAPEVLPRENSPSPAKAHDDASEKLFHNAMEAGHTQTGKYWHTDREKAAAFLAKQIKEDQKIEDPNARAEKLAEDAGAVDKFDAYDKKDQQYVDRHGGAVHSKIDKMLDGFHITDHGYGKPEGPPKDPGDGGVRPQDLPSGSALAGPEKQPKAGTPLETPDDNGGKVVSDSGKLKDGTDYRGMVATNSDGQITHAKEEYGDQGPDGKGTKMKIPGVDGDVDVKSKSTDRDPKTGKYSTSYELPDEKDGYGADGKGSGHTRIVVHSDAAGNPEKGPDGKPLPVEKVFVGADGKPTSKPMTIGGTDGGNQGFKGNVQKVESQIVDGKPVDRYYFDDGTSVTKTTTKNADGTTDTDTVADAGSVVGRDAAVYDGSNIVAGTRVASIHTHEYMGDDGYPHRKDVYVLANHGGKISQDQTRPHNRTTEWGGADTDRWATVPGSVVRSNE